ncbi:inositol hexakisphosphate and diphosphoinositol-pentakisphosphate kinase [Dipsacomyces acuminosporus]|nr:inositol hexakisphosphate and diphosphoinositol-pentakisphosphate kinase [Dipsacomyces acuminosporus]
MPGSPAVVPEHSRLSTSPHFIDLPQFEGRKPIIGICAMDSKSRSKPMTNILNRLVAANQYELVFFGEKTILDEDIEKWPICDFLISFFSKGFPLEKAFQYFRLRKPFSVNSLIRQFLLFDRRLVLEVLDHVGVPTPKHLVVSRDGGPSVHPALQRVLEQRMGYTPGSTQYATEVEEIDQDTIKIGDQVIHKPFVEKPCDAEDHNIYIYYSSKQGGGVRKLFRKIGNKSSEFYPGPAQVRRDGSYIYEEFIDVDNSVDVKVYTVGRDYAHAETRKSPVVDGHVRRNSDGKEMRFVTQLSPEELEYAQRVSDAFGQRVCGFDLLRAHGKSMVIDVNGWSFVKGNDSYYDTAAQILHERFQEALHHRWFARFVDADTVGRVTYESRWVLKGVFNVCRHADRTPKQKVKHILSNPPIMRLLGGAKTEVIFRQKPELFRALDALKSVLSTVDPNGTDISADSHANIEQLVDVLERKIDFPGTKVQLKPQKDKKTGAVDGVQVILKWGGECTHAGIVQSQDLAENMRKDLLLINKHLLEDVKMYSSTERRVLSTVSSYGGAFFDGAEFMNKVEVRSDMLDDSTVAKDEMEVAKTQLRGFFNFSGPLEQNPYFSPCMQLPKDMGNNPREFVQKTCDIMCRLIARMERNFEDLGKDGVYVLQSEWCCNETADLFRERWKKILSDFQSVDKKTGQVVYDPAKVGELYDSLKYDALHNRHFLERIFMSPDKLSAELAAAAHSSALASECAGCQECTLDGHHYHDAVFNGPASSASMRGIDGMTAEYARSMLGSFASLSFTSSHVQRPRDPSIISPVPMQITASSALRQHGTSASSPVRETPLSVQALSHSYEHSAPPEYPPDPLFTQQEVRELYYKAKILFDFVTQREYGIEAPQRKKIGIQASVPLLKQLIKDLNDVKKGKAARTRFYFTKESHIHTLLNLVFLCDMQTMIPYEKVGELDYLTHIIFEVYERKPDVDAGLDRDYSLRIGFSPGANCFHVLDMNIDSTHALKVLPRRNFTYHISLDKAIRKLEEFVRDEVAKTNA